MKKGKWSADEMLFLRENYPCLRRAAIASRLDRPVHSVDYMARRLGLKRGGAIYERKIDLSVVSQEDLAYAAGFIDADGSVSIAQTKRKRKTPIFSPAISVSGINRAMMSWFAHLFGGHVQKGRASWSSKQLYIVNLNRIADALTLLEAIEPFTKLKKEQVRIVIQFCKGKLTREGREGDRIQQEQWLKQVQELNKKGGLEVQND